MRVQPERCKQCISPTGDHEYLCARQSDMVRSDIQKRVE